MTTQTVLPVGGVAGTWRGELHDTSRTDALWARLQRWWAAYKTYRFTYEELRMLSDRDLADIGIARSDIRKIAQQSAQAAVAGTSPAA